MNTRPPTALRSALLCAILAAALAQSGCKGCDGDEPPPPPAAEASPGAVEEAPPTQVPPPKAPAPKTAAPAPKAPYLGPSSENSDGYKLTSGFSDENGKAVRQPKALETGHMYVTALSPDSRPLGALGTLAGAQMHGFLVARDMRQAWYASAAGPIADGADARDLVFKPLEGGDHALIVAFATEDGQARTVATPVVITGALPALVGPRVAGLTRRSRAEEGQVELLTVPSHPIAGHPVALAARKLDASGAEIGPYALPFALVYNSEMGRGLVVTTREGKRVFTPKAPGTWLVLAPPPAGKRALAFKLVVAPPPEAPPPPAPPAKEGAK